jgi:signal transduction histidine kinase
MIAWFSRKKKTEAPLSRKDDFVSLSSHELRSPLSIIKWYTEILLDEDAGPLNEEQKKYLTVIENSNQRAIDLIRSLLNVSRLDLDTFGISPEGFFIPDVVSGLIASVQSEALKKKIEFVEEKEEGLKNILVDKHLVTLVLKQPLTNAIAFSKNGGSIKVSTFCVSSGGTVGGMVVPEESIIVSVTDSGIGIPDADQSKIFTKMFRGSNVEDTAGSDSGLGLYVAKTVMNLPYVEGDMWFTSTVGQGTTFYTAFPTKGMKKKEGRTVLE